MKIIKVVYIDMAYNPEAWKIDRLSTFGTVRMEIVGHLVEEREDCLILAGEHWTDENEVRHLTAIPKEGIVSREELK